MIYVSLTNWREQYLVQKARGEGDARVMSDMRSEIDHLVDRMADNEIRYREDLRAARHDYNEREDRLLRQVQTMAERIAKLTLNKDNPAVASEPTPFIPEDSTPVPYSQALFDFVSGLETDDARVLVEEYVERRRSLGVDDISILEQLNRGEYVDG